jgi:hypothetical protein
MRHETDFSSPFSAEVTNGWSHTSIFLHHMHRDNFTFYYSTKDQYATCVKIFKKPVIHPEVILTAYGKPKKLVTLRVF